MKSQAICPVCNSTQWNQWGSFTIRPDEGSEWHFCQKRLNQPLEVHIERRICRDCGCVFRSPVWDEAEFERIYSAETWELLKPSPKDLLRVPPSVRHQTLRNKQVRREAMVKLILEHACLSSGNSEPAVGDIGGGDGFYVEPFVERGWAASVIDPLGPEVVDPRIQKLTLRFEELGVTGKFDAIILSHVLEHLSTFKEFIGRVGRILKTGGVVYVEVPYEVHRVLLRREHTEPGHFVYFSTATLQYLFELNGFVVRHCVRQRATYNISRILSIVLIAQKIFNETKIERIPSPGRWPMLREMISPSVIGYMLQNRLSVVCEGFVE